MVATMENLCRATGFTRDIVNKIIARHMRTELAPAHRHLPRVFSRENVFEIMVISSLADMPRDDAAEIAAHWRTLEKQGKLPRYWAFCEAAPTFRRSGRPNGFGFSSPAVTLDTIVRAADLFEGVDFEEAPSVRIVDIGGIVRRAEQLCAADEKGD